MQEINKNKTLRDFLPLSPFEIYVRNTRNMRGVTIDQIQRRL